MQAGCRGLRVGGAKVSEMHCNFLINDGSATAEDIERLGETVRARVKAACGITLHWEIIRRGLCPRGPADWRSLGGGAQPMTSAQRRFQEVAVLLGGFSAEREVSLRSGKACAEALESGRLHGHAYRCRARSCRAPVPGAAGGVLQRPARALGRGRLRAGPAGDPGHPLYAFRRAGLRAWPCTRSAPNR